MAQSTTIIFVPGAWHNPDCFDPVVQRLEALHYRTDKVHLPSVGPLKHYLNFDADVVQIRSQIEESVNFGQNVVMLVHSYGSLPSNEAVRGLDLKSRQQRGLSGGVSHIFFCCSFVIEEGDSLIGAFGGQDLPWFLISDDKLEVNPINPEKVFYNDCDHEKIGNAIAALRPHSYQTFQSPCTYAAWKDVPSTYLYCTQDAALPLSIQKTMVEKTAKWTRMRTDSVDASHSPFLSKPEEVTLAIRRAVGEPV